MRFYAPVRCPMYGSAFGLLLACLSFFSVINGIPLVANAVTLTATKVGQYTDGGTHVAGTSNYVVGRDNFFGDTLFRQFGVFNLASVSGTISSATLSIFNPDYTSPDPSETISYFDVSTPPNQLDVNNQQGPGIVVYNDLGSGTLFGAVTVDASSVNSTVTVQLNSSAISSLNASVGSLWAIGGAMTTLTAPEGTQEHVFGFTGITPWTLTLVVPEPSTFVLAVLSLGAFITLRRSR